MTSVSSQPVLTEPAKTVILSGGVTFSLQGSDLLYEVSYITSVVPAKCEDLGSRLTSTLALLSHILTHKLYPPVHFDLPGSLFFFTEL